MSSAVRSELGLLLQRLISLKHTRASMAFWIHYLRSGFVAQAALEAYDEAEEPTEDAEAEDFARGLMESING
jgi:hypothetical protein